MARWHGIAAASINMAKIYQRKWHRNISISGVKRNKYHRKKWQHLALEIWQGGMAANS